MVEMYCMKESIFNFKKITQATPVFTSMYRHSSFN